MKAVPVNIKMMRILEQSGHVLACVLLVLFFTTVQSLAKQNELAVLPPPVINSEYFPCSTCHEQSKMVQEEHMQEIHKSIKVKGHVEKSYGCLGCHDREDFDKLTLFNGGKIDLARSSQLCGQCHSTSYKLWQSGLHGKVVGKWNGPKKITPCTRCHDPHQPVYKAQQPEPPPAPPEKTLRWNK